MTDETKQALCVILVSTDDCKTWAPVKTESVPEWVKNPDVMANLIHGEMAQQPTGLVNDLGVRPWYRAERIDADGKTVQ